MNDLLVIGRSGYIRSHACVKLLRAKNPVMEHDHFGNSQPEVLQGVERIIGKSLTSARGEIVGARSFSGDLYDVRTPHWKIVVHARQEKHGIFLCLLQMASLAVIFEKIDCNLLADIN